MNLIERTIGTVRNHFAVAQVRAEHDAWAQQATAGAYRSALGTFWATYTFTRSGRGLAAGQWVTDLGTNSWSVWMRYGPLIAEATTVDEARQLYPHSFAAFRAA